MSPADLARRIEQQRSDAAYTQALAAQIALQLQRVRLQKQRAQSVKESRK